MANMKYIPCLALGALSGLVCSLPATAADGLSVEHLGTSNTLVRVSDDARYVLFPVEESVDDAALTLLLDGRQESTFYVRLARNKVDYYVPFDISRYKGRNIIFNIVTAQGRSSVREASDDACWKTICLSDTFDIADDVGKYRPAYHHTPLYGWMNDPNGMFYRDGVWHLYYQYNPYGSKWQNMTWGHSSSTDLINWDHHSPAIEPNGFGSVFSGSCVVDSAGSAGFGPGAVVALYTSAGLNQMQSLAHSADGGDTFTVYLGNPILTLESEARDPNMFWNAETGEWNMLLAHALDREMLIFSSHDLKTWTLQSAFGKGLGAQDGVWECPDLMRLPVEGTGEHKWVLICNLNPGGPFGGSATQYFVGDFDGKTFTADTDAEGRVAGVLVSYDGARLLELRRSFFEVAARVLGLHFDDSLEAETDPGEIYLDSLAVFPGYRGKGLAGRLIEAAAERHAGSGKPLGLLVDVPNTGAYRLYTRLGFGKAGERPFAGVMMDHLQRRL